MTSDTKIWILISSNAKKEGKKVTLVDQLESPKMELFVIE